MPAKGKEGQLVGIARRPSFPAGEVFPTVGWWPTPDAARHRAAHDLYERLPANIRTLVDTHKPSTRGTLVEFFDRARYFRGWVTLDVRKVEWAIEAIRREDELIIEQTALGDQPEVGTRRINDAAMLTKVGHLLELDPIRNVAAAVRAAYVADNRIALDSDVRRLRRKLSSKAEF